MYIFINNTGSSLCTPYMREQSYVSNCAMLRYFYNTSTVLTSIAITPNPAVQFRINFR